MNATGQTTSKIKNCTNPPQNRLVQQTLPKSLLNTKTRHSSIGDLSDLDKTTVPQSSFSATISGNSKKSVDWQSVPVPRQHKRRRTSRTPSPTTQKIPTSNKFEDLDIDVADVETSKTALGQHQNKPPPIMLYGVEDISKLSDLIKTKLHDNEFSIKIITRKQLRLNCPTIDSYKQLMEIVRENNLIGHTFTRKDKKPYRIVIKNLHHTTPIAAIKEAMEKSGNQVIGEIINARYGPERIPLSTFFQYGHTKNNCLRPFRCVKCAENHNTIDCPKKDRNSPAKCALCLGEHPANYKGCQVYLEINKRKNYQQKRVSKPENKKQARTGPENIADKENATNISHARHDLTKTNRVQSYTKGHSPSPYKEGMTYAEITKCQQEQKNIADSKLEILLTKQAEKLDKLLDHMATLMSLLTTVIAKLAR
ncbi:hypothetical protein ABMA27_000230 [Loxostege sticticalis]|uniref:Nucleic-acid-binding protein from transposon X-element n=1 Tax=Loxostege sticticalis TaxID=481309 RepID=A0ABR3IMN3_LOXSC